MASKNPFKSIALTDFGTVPFSDPTLLRTTLTKDAALTPVREVRARPGEPDRVVMEIDSGVGERLGDLPVPGSDGTEVALRSFCDEADTTGLIVLHRGTVVHSEFRDDFGSADRHVIESASASVFSLLLATLIADGTIDEDRLIGDIVPELADTGFGRARIADAFHINTTMRYGHRPFRRQPEAGSYFVAAGLIPVPDGYAGPVALLDQLTTERQDDPNGQMFRYQNGNTEALGEVVRRVTGTTIAALFEERIHSRIGADHDAHFGLDATGREIVSVRYSSTLQDFARIGQLIAEGGAVGSTQVVPEEVVDGLRSLADGDSGSSLGSGAAVPGGRPFFAFRRGWWQTLDGEGALVASGRAGQRLYINPGRQTVIAHVGAHPVDGSRSTPRYEEAFAAISTALGQQRARTASVINPG